MEQNGSERFQRLIMKLRNHKQSLSSAESCTGGGFGYVITSISGASMVYKGGCITYTADTKLKLLHIPQDVLERYGVYSIECAQEMARGVCAATLSDIGVSFTGVADNIADPACPAGTIYIGIASAEYSYADKFVFTGDRDHVRFQAIIQGAELVEQFLDGKLSLLKHDFHKP